MFFSGETDFVGGKHVDSRGKTDLGGETEFFCSEVKDICGTFVG